mgnify:CR=1 FL=1
MPQTRTHLVFDDYLKRTGIVRNKDYAKVHDWMSSFNQVRRRIYSNIDINTVREWIVKKSNSTDEAELTDYLRVALGHLFLDSLSYNFVFESEYEFMKKAIEGYTDKEYGSCSVNCFFAENTC